MTDDEITHDDLLAALVRALDGVPGAGGHSFAEIQEATGWHTVKIRRSLKQLQRSGRLQVGRAPRMNIAGITSPVPVYAIKQDNAPIEEKKDSHKLEEALVSPPGLLAQQ